MNMKEPETWRELLGWIISDQQERQRIAETAGINPVTLIRWATNKSNPRLDNLRPLLSALPQYHQQLVRLIAVEYPQVLSATPVLTEITPEIPSAFYARIMNAHTSSPALLRGSVIGTLILQQLLEHLDPQQFGLIALIVQCMPPSVSGGRVRSLRKTVGRGTSPWHNIEHTTCFLGAEAQVGRTLTTGRFTVIQSGEEKLRLFPSHYIEEIESAVTYPILLADRVAGCLGIISTRRHYFTQMRLDLIQCYVDLLALAFGEREFYPLQDINLGIMPPIMQQQSVLASFQQRVTQRLVEAAQNHQAITRTQVEQVIWWEIEEELLR
jgi:hypothetical protein